MTAEDFLSRTGLQGAESTYVLENWPMLHAIAVDHDKSQLMLSSIAEQISARLRTFAGVHSVRWRVKDTDHLLKKIIRKKSQLAEVKRGIEGLGDTVDASLSRKLEALSKWDTVDASNYFSVVTDLVGVRALHLFWDDCVGIDERIRESWEPAEDVVIYSREGDRPIDKLIDAGAVTEIHGAGYRSVHYIVNTKPERRELKVEIQVRTLFQEGWSEIDHTVRYPDYSDNESISSFLGIFNALAGSADTMGTYVKELVSLLSANEELVKRANEDAAKALVERQAAVDDVERQNVEMEKMRERMEGTLDELNRLGAKGQDQERLIKQLRRQLKDYSDSGVAVVKSASVLPELSLSDAQKVLKKPLVDEVNDRIFKALLGLRTEPSKN